MISNHLGEKIKTLNIALLMACASPGNTAAEDAQARDSNYANPAATEETIAKGAVTVQKDTASPVVLPGNNDSGVSQGVAEQVGTIKVQQTVNSANPY
ncbi:hypothetical protein [Suttonella ornithocola]|uniref:Uncharacterized protein n=1 Tax=Suttonella ornithocola TaxID=279832 RepID=A0A380MN93_9GAMM|nr:hypothetical protein [Suttonella ornithocola]SUO94100.1 Uncharacterised protein [Suttonella ornithocola]